MPFEKSYLETTQRIERELDRIADENPQLGRPTRKFSPIRYSLDKRQGSLWCELDDVPDIYLIGTAERLLARIPGLSDPQLKLYHQTRTVSVSMLGGVMLEVGFEARG